jgi:hypothetical protein
VWASGLAPGYGVVPVGQSFGFTGLTAFELDPRTLRLEWDVPFRWGSGVGFTFGPWV